MLNVILFIWVDVKFIRLILHIGDVEFYAELYWIVHRVLLKCIEADSEVY